MTPQLPARMVARLRFVALDVHVLPKSTPTDPYRKSDAKYGVMLPETVMELATLHPADTSITKSELRAQTTLDIWMSQSRNVSTLVILVDCVFLQL